MDPNSGRKANNARKSEKDSYSTSSPVTLLVLFLSIFLSVPGYSQFAQLEISTSDGETFFVAKNDTLVSDRSATKHLFKIFPGDHVIWIIIDSTLISQQFPISVNKDRRYIYQLGISNDKLSLLSVGVNELDTTPAPAPVKPVAKKGKKPAPVVKAKPEPGRRIPGITLDSLLLMAQLKSYSGKFGCKMAISDLTFKEEIKTIRVMDFERERLGSVTELLKNNCLRVDQLSLLLELFEFDDTRLSLVCSAKGHVLDLGNLPKLEEKFTFSRSRERLLEIIKEF